MPPLKFDPEANVEEIAGLGRRSRFDAVIEKPTRGGRVHAFYRAIAAGERYPLKFHGNLENAAEGCSRRGFLWTPGPFWNMGEPRAGARARHADPLPFFRFA